MSEKVMQRVVELLFWYLKHYAVKLLFKKLVVKFFFIKIKMDKNKCPKKKSTPISLH
jgi:hypothetical protein